MNINRRLETMRERLERFRPCTMTITLKSGRSITADPSAVWDFFLGYARKGRVAAVSSDRGEYAAAAGIMTVLCHPVADRRLEDFE